MLLALCRCQLIHINHTSINIATFIIGGRLRHSILRIRWSPTRYWRGLQLCRCVLWRSGGLLANLGYLRWINYWIIQWRRHRYHRLWQLITLWVTVLAIKSPVITSSVLWRAGWMLTNWRYLRLIDDWIIQCRRHMYHKRWQLIDLWVTVLDIKAPVITRICSLSTLIVTCYTFVVTTNTLWKWHDECNMSLWWVYVPVILFVCVYQKVRSNCFLRQENLKKYHWGSRLAFFLSLTSLLLFLSSSFFYVYCICIDICQLNIYIVGR